MADPRARDKAIAQPLERRLPDIPAPRQIALGYRSRRNVLTLNWNCWPMVIVVGLLIMSLAPRAFDSVRMLAAAQAYGARAVAAAGSLQKLISQGSHATPDSRVRATNQFFNEVIAYADDIDIWAVNDYWASPLEALGKGAGDCEDYALAKYFSLAAMGVPLAKLRLVYVKAGGAGVPQVQHMVLAFYPAPGAEPLILDNLMNDVRLASQRPDLLPVFSFNSEGMWQGVGGQLTGDASSRLSKWRTVLARAREQGF